MQMRRNNSSAQLDEEDVNTYGKGAGRIFPVHPVRTVVNLDPALGGMRFNPPKLTPLLEFTKACEKTPNSNQFVWVIPWDNKNKDYVYPALDDNIFMGRMTILELKQVETQNLKNC